MRLGGVTRGFLHSFRGWDGRSRLAFMIAGGLMIALVVFGRGLPDDQRQNALIGIAGLFIVMQGIFLYANRGMVSALTAAQRQYLAGEFDAARQTLETALEKGGRPDFRALTLLGNTYRQLGQVEDSLNTLTKAVQAAPNHHFPRYGFGRTLMTAGRYADAAEAFAHALAYGAPTVAYLDQAEALWRMGDPDSAAHALGSVGTPDEPYRALWADYLRHRLTGGERPTVTDGDALVYWQAMAERFAHTPYGAALAADVAYLVGSDVKTPPQEGQ